MTATLSPQAKRVISFASTRLSPAAIDALRAEKKAALARLKEISAAKAVKAVALPPNLPPTTWDHPGPGRIGRGAPLAKGRYLPTA